MSEVATRGSATRGRGGFRGGRGGYRGSRGGKPHSSREEQETVPPLEEQGQLGELKAKYADKLSMMREICEGCSDEDLVKQANEWTIEGKDLISEVTCKEPYEWKETTGEEWEFSEPAKTSKAGSQFHVSLCPIPRVGYLSILMS